MDKNKAELYVSESLKKGVSLDMVKQSLLAVGWPVPLAEAALVAGLLASGVPAPEGGADGIQRGKGKLASTVEVVLNLFSFILLGAVAYALITLYYQVINKFFPDPLLLRSGISGVDSGTIHYAIASLIITFPLYVVAVRMWFKRFREDAEKVETKLTKWITYLVLLVTALTVVGDLVAALFKLLQGELSMRFILEALTILLTAGGIFGFYFLERKKIQFQTDIPRSTFIMFGWATMAFVVLGVILGFVVAGSPQTERMRGFDAQRSEDLRNLANCVSSFAMTQKALPETLVELSQSTQYSYCSSNTIDPETALPYAYKVISPLLKGTAVPQASFELCADFSLDSVKGAASGNIYAYPNDKWSAHASGKVCTTETANLGNLAVPYNSPSTQPIMTK